MRKVKFIRFLFYFLAAILSLILVLSLIYNFSVRISEPDIPAGERVTLKRIQLSDTSFLCENGWIRKSGEGWWEMYLEGSPYEIGYAHGLLTKELMAYQEQAFTGRLAELIPGKCYQKFMLAFVRYFNRNLDKYVQFEYRKEIYGISRSAPEEYEFIGPAYARMLNYHAAHDLGHAVQNMNLVACTAFGAWDGHTADSSLIIGRNFDFFINDEFAENKILCFVKPDIGYSFVSVTWAGFAGVVSGMNEKGLTVTLNAAKSSIPLGAKTPVSLLAREILQYASDIDDALSIARSAETFVAESFLVGSASDGKVVVIEKKPDATAVYDPGKDHILLTNHFQSEEFINDQLNVEVMKDGVTVYRLERLKELVAAHPAMTPEDAAMILRDYKGLDGEDIGMGDERAVNQFISHHSVIFNPESKIIRVSNPPFSNPPWTLGAYHGYQIDSVFNYGLEGIKRYELYSPVLTIPADSLLRGFESLVVSR